MGSQDSVGQCESLVRTPQAQRGRAERGVGCVCHMRTVQQGSTEARRAHGSPRSGHSVHKAPSSTVSGPQPVARLTLLSALLPPLSPALPEGYSLPRPGLLTWRSLWVCSGCEYPQGQAWLCSGTLLSPCIGPRVGPAEESCRAVFTATFIPSTGNIPRPGHHPTHQSSLKPCPTPCPIEAMSLQPAPIPSLVP